MMKLKLMPLYLLFILQMFAVDIAVGQVSVSPETTLQLNPGPNNPRNSEGDFVTLNDKSILFIYSHFVGDSPSDFGNSHLASRRSYDNGTTWTDSDKIVVENEGTMNVMSVSLLRLQNGQIALFYARKNSINDCIPQMRISRDEGQSWSSPISCITDYPGYYVINNDRVIQLANGRLLMPVALHESKLDSNKGLNHSFNQYGIIYCYYSDDNGQSWKKQKAINISQDILAQEPGIVELGNGHVLMFIRTDSGVQYQSISKNKGKTWSKAVPTDIPSPVSPASIERIPNSNDLVLIWNNNGVKGGGSRAIRTPFNIAISQNEGLTWKNVKTIQDDPNGWYCYTSIHFVNKKEFLLGYCAGNRPDGTGLSVTNITKLNTIWLYE